MGFKNTLTLVLLACAFTLLLALGFWQTQRLEWKESIISAIEEQETKDPMQFPLTLSEQQPKEFERGYLQGSFMPQGYIFIGPRTSPDGDVGRHALRLFQTDRGQTVLVNAGWVKGLQGQSPSASAFSGKLAGHFRTPEAKGAFIPQNRPKQGLWYWADMEAIGNHYQTQNLYPMIFYLETPSMDGIQPFNGLPKPRNKHAQYALFWFGMAGLLIVLSGLYILRRHK